MLKRNVLITFRLDESERTFFKNLARKSGLSGEAYLRHLINGLVPTDAPPPDYFAMMKQIHYIGVNLKQIAQKAHKVKALDVKRYDENVSALNRAVTEITNAVMLARKLKVTPQAGKVRNDRRPAALKRDKKIAFRLDAPEWEKLKIRVQKSGLSRETYLRQLINSLVPTDAPPPDYFAMMKELHYIGVNLNQIARKAHTLNALDVKRYDENIAELNRAVTEITNAVMLARKLNVTPSAADGGK